MDPTTIRNAIGFARRQWWVIAQAMLVVGVVTAFMATRDKAPLFRAEASVQIHSDADQSSGVFEQTAQGILNAQVRFIHSAPVIDAAAAAAGLPAAEIASAIGTSTDASTGLITVRANSADPGAATVIANAVANAYVDNRNAAQTQVLRDEAERVNDELDVLLASIVEVRTQLAGVGVEVDALTSETPTSGITVPATVSGDADVPTLLARLESLNTKYTATVQRQQDVIVQVSLRPNVAEVIDSAVDAVQPPRRSPVKQGLLGAFVGMLAGVGLAVLRELLDDRAHSRDELAKVTGKMVIAELPWDSPSSGSRRRPVGLASIERPHDPLAEAVRQLRTSVSFLAVDEAIGCVTVTSAEPDEGKSLVAANLAAAFAQAGVDTILLSGDLRRPSLDARMLPAGALGFSDLIMSRVDAGGGAAALVAGNGRARRLPVNASDVIFTTQLPHLRFVPVGTVPPNPAELLASKAAAAAVAELRAQCEMLIIDSPPTLVTDGVILANLSDAALLVAAIGQSHRSRVVSALETLDAGHVRVLGIVLNKVKSWRGGYQSYAPATGNASKRRSGRAMSTGRLLNVTDEPATEPQVQPSLFPDDTMRCSPSLALPSSVAEVISLKTNHTPTPPASLSLPPPRTDVNGHHHGNGGSHIPALIGRNGEGASGLDRPVTDATTEGRQ